MNLLAKLFGRRVSIQAQGTPKNTIHVRHEYTKHPRFRILYGAQGQNAVVKINNVYLHDGKYFAVIEFDGERE